MSELTYQEMAIIINSAIGASVADLARVLPHMTFSEREAIVSQAKRLNAYSTPGEPGNVPPTEQRDYQ